MEELEPKDGISRRKMIKRIGAGAAIAWTAPILTSIRTPAFAASGAPGCTADAGCAGCAACPFVTPCHGRSDCQCWMASADNGSICVCNFFVQFCGQTPACPNGQGDCAAAGVPDSCCVQSCCGQFCAPKCAAQGSKLRSVSGGARTTR